MAKKQVTATEGVAAAAPARAAKPKTTTPRVRTVKHSKTISPEPAVAPESAVIAESVIAPVEPVSADTPQTHIDHVVDHHAAISRIAYSYWEARGYQGGSQDDDWLRAEHEYRQSLEQL